MPLVNMKDMLEHAYRHKYAVGAFDVVNLEFLQGTLEAAERCRGPVILSVPASRLSSSELEVTMSAAEAAARNASVPVAVHLEDGCDLASALHAISQGCNSLKINCADQPFGDNVRQTAEVAAVAHGCGVTVEGQLGCLPSPGGDQAPSAAQSAAYTTVAEAKAFAERTCVDCLSVHVGTAHGTAKGKRKVDWSRLKQINETLGLPLVIHIGTPLSDNQVYRLIAGGAAKINDHTLSDTVAQRLQMGFDNSGADFENIIRNVRESVGEQVERRMRVWGTAGRAAEVLERCEHWAPVDEIIHYRGDALEEAALESTMARGVETLGSIPGVRSVSVVKSPDAGNHPRFSWLVRFCHASASEAAMQYPDYAAFADKHARPANGGGTPSGGLADGRASPLPGSGRHSEWGGSRAKPLKRRPGVEGSGRLGL